MISSFQIKNKSANKNTISNCTHHKHRLLRQAEQPFRQIQNIPPQSQDKQKHQQKTQLKSDQWTQQIKYLVASNSQYFQNKMKVSDNVKPNNYRFKIPTKTGSTVYTHDYWKKKKNMSADNIKLNSNTFKTTKLHTQFDGKTTYQNQFIPMKSELIIKDRKSAKNNWVRDEEEAPRFMDTQNNCFFLNWGGKNYVPSMKPEAKPTVTNIPFEGTSVYNNDFQGKYVQAAKKYIRQSSIPKFGNKMMINKSCYASQFSQKQSHKQASCKPEHKMISIFKSLNGTTQYKSQFRKSNTAQGTLWKDKTIEEMQTLILDL